MVRARRGAMVRYSTSNTQRGPDGQCGAPSLTSPLPVITVRGRDRPRPRVVLLRLPPRGGSAVQTPSTTSAAPFVLAALLTAACATLPHPPTGAMWGYLWTPAAAPSLEIVGYTADRPSCEYSRLRSETRGGVPVPSQLLAPCQQLDVLPHREGAASVYWVFVAEAGTDHFAAG